MAPHSLFRNKKSVSPLEIQPQPFIAIAEKSSDTPSPERAPLPPIKQGKDGFYNPHQESNSGDEGELDHEKFRIAPSGHGCGVLFPPSPPQQSSSKHDSSDSHGRSSTNNATFQANANAPGLPRTISLPKFPKSDQERRGVPALSISTSWSGFIASNPHLSASQVDELKEGWPNKLPAWFWSPEPLNSPTASTSRRNVSASLDILNQINESNLLSDSTVQTNESTAQMDEFTPQVNESTQLSTPVKDLFPMIPYDLDRSFVFPARSSSSEEKIAENEAKPGLQEAFQPHRPVPSLTYHQKGFSGTDDADWETEVNSQVPSRWDPGLSMHITSDSLADNSDSNGHSRSSSVFSEDIPLPLALPVVQPRVNTYQHPSPMSDHHSNPFSSSPPQLDTHNDRDAVLPKSRVQARVMEFEKKGEFTTYRFPKETNVKKRNVSTSRVEPRRVYTRELSNASFLPGNNAEMEWTLNDETPYDAGTDEATQNRTQLTLDEADGMMGHEDPRTSMDIADLPMVVERRVHLPKLSSAFLSTVEEASDETRTSSVFESVYSITVPRSSRIGSAEYDGRASSVLELPGFRSSLIQATSPTTPVHSPTEDYDASLNSMNANASSLYVNVTDRGRNRGRNHTVVHIRDLFDAESDDDPNAFDPTPLVFEGRAPRARRDPSPRQRMRFQRQTSEGSLHPLDEPQPRTPKLTFDIEEGRTEKSDPSPAVTKFKELATGCGTRVARGYKACVNATTPITTNPHTPSRDEQIRVRLESAPPIGRYHFSDQYRDFEFQYGMPPRLEATPHARPFDHETHRLYISVTILMLSLCVPPTAIIVGHGFADGLIVRVSNGDFNQLTRRVEVVGLVLGYMQVVAALCGLLFWLGFRVAGS